jgi:beta-glucosidase/6-phospho-beta-glucosidase/beta-galactosidase
LFNTLNIFNPVTHRPGQTVAEGTDLRHEPPRSLYAEGFYESIMLAHELGKSVWITENGFPTNSIEKRMEYFKKHFYALSKAIEEGVTVDGYIWWTLVDNYEWNAGIGNYGLFDFDRNLKSNAAYFVELLLSAMKRNHITR